MARTTVENARVSLGAGIDLVAITITYEVWNGNGATESYNTNTIEGLDGDNDMDSLAKLAYVLQNLPEDGALDFDKSDLEDYLKDYAAELAETAELPFTFTDSYGSAQTYTPASLWESSGSCEWETSAQEGYDYGWNV